MINLCILRKRKTFLKLGFGNQDISRVSTIKGLPHFSCSLHHYSSTGKSTATNDFPLLFSPHSIFFLQNGYCFCNWIEVPLESRDFLSSRTSTEENRSSLDSSGTFCGAPLEIFCRYSPGVLTCCRYLQNVETLLSRVVFHRHFRI